MDLVAQNVFFFLIAGMMVVAAWRVVTTANIVHAALWLILVLAGAAGQFILLVAEFTAVTQVLVYIGAIVVLFLFGIMLTRAPLGNSLEVDRKQQIMALAVSIPLAGLLGYALIDSYSDTEVNFDGAVAAAEVTDVTASDAPEVDGPASDAADSDAVDSGDGDSDVVDSDVADTGDGDSIISSDAEATAAVDAALDETALVLPDGSEGGSNTKAVSDSIFGNYLIAFEAISVLLLAALIGAICLARRD